MSEDLLKAAISKNTEKFAKIFRQELLAAMKMKKEATMQVTYNGFTGELVKLEKKETGRYMVTPYDTAKHPVFGYDISIYDREKKATISFTGVKLGDVKFGGGAVTFDE